MILNKFKKSISGLLACAITVTSISFPNFLEEVDAAASSMQLTDVNWTPNGYDKTYKSTLFGSSEQVHVFSATVEGVTGVRAFCNDLGKAMSSSYKGTWNLSNTLQSNSPIKYLLDYYYHHYFMSLDYEAKYPNLSEKEISKIALSEGNFYWSGWTRDTEGHWIQSAVWAAKAGVLPDPASDINTFAQKMAKERHDILNFAMGSWNYDPSDPDGTKYFKDIYQNYLAGKFTSYEYGIYSYSGGGSGVQQLLTVTPNPPDIVGDSSVFLKGVKQSNTGSNISGAKFKAYIDSSCTIPYSNIEFELGQNVPPVEIVLKPTDVGKDITLYIKEVKAPIGYKVSSTVYSVTVNSNNNGTAATAAQVNNGSPIINDILITKIPPSVWKVDADTGVGIGVATFSIEGESEDGHYINKFVSSDENGFVDLQWTDSGQDNYIPPGSYTVTEENPPLGYVKDYNSQHWVIWIDDKGQPQQSGDLRFFNRKKPTVKLIKRDGLTSDVLEGATFDVYRNGTKIDSYTTNSNGEIVLDNSGEGLEEGYYTFIETAAPPGYILPHDTVHSVHVVPGDMSEYEIVALNYEYPELIIQKFENGTTVPLEGATFKVTINGKELSSFVTQADGTIVLTYDDYGTFLNEHNEENTITVEEVGAPDGYIIDTKPQTIVYEQGMKNLTVTFENTPYPEIEILKRDKETDEPLAGAVFEVEINGVNIGQFTTDETGTKVIIHDEYGEFLNTINGVADFFDKGWEVTVTETSPGVVVGVGIMILLA